MGHIFVFFLILIQSTHIYAQRNTGVICDSIFKSVNYGCDDLAKANGLGGSYPLLIDAFNLNPASLPTYLTPVGVESFFDGSKTNFALIKGVKRTGFGFSSSTTEGTFFSDVDNTRAMDVLNEDVQVFYDEYAQHHQPKLNFATAFNILEIKSIFSSSIGATYRYNRLTKEKEKVLGSIIKTKYLSFGGSLTERNENNKLLVMALGSKLGNFLFEYTQLIQQEGAKVRTNIASMTYANGSLSLSIAFRKQNNPEISDEDIVLWGSEGIIYKREHTLYGFNYRFYDKLTIGFYHNYILNKGSSFLVQYFF